MPASHVSELLISFLFLVRYSIFVFSKISNTFAKPLHLGAIPVIFFINYPVYDLQPIHLGRFKPEYQL